MRRKKNTVSVQRACNIRDYIYKAVLSTKTGKLLYIEAGCRRWLSFDEALAHYDGKQEGHWSNDAYVNNPKHENSPLLYAYRLEARGLLRALRNDARNKGFKIIEKIEKEKQAKKRVKR